MVLLSLSRALAAVTVEVDVGDVSWSVVGSQKFLKTAHWIFLIFCMKLGDHKVRKVTRPDFPKKIQILHHFVFVPFLRVFGHFIQFGSSDLAENRYLERLDHYLQLSNWSHVQENPFSPSKIGPNVENFGFLIKFFF